MPIYITTCTAVALVMQMIALIVAKYFLDKHKESPLGDVKNTVIFTIVFFCFLTVVMAWRIPDFSKVLFFIACCFFLSLFIFLDSASYCLPALFTVPFFIVGCWYRYLFEQQSMPEAVIVSVSLFFGLGFMRAVCNRQRGTETFGLGDVYLIAGLGMWFSSPYVFWAVGIAAFAGMIFIKFTSRRVVPFAPFLCFITALMLPFPNVFFS